jgi:hypothetical protein
MDVMELTLNFRERLIFGTIFGEMTGKVSELAVIQSLYDKISLSEEEEKAASLTKVPMDGGNVNVRWNEDAAQVLSKTFDVSGRESEKLLAVVEGYTGWKRTDAARAEELMAALRQKS